MKPLTVLACALCLVVGVFWYGSSQRSLGRQEGRVEEIRAKAVEAGKAVSRADTVFVHTRDTLRRYVTRWDSIRATDTIVLRVHEKPESVVVYVPRQVADSAISMCLRTLSACDASLRARDSLLSIQRVHIKSLEAMKSSRFGGLLRNALIFGAGVGAGALIRR